MEKPSVGEIKQGLVVQIDRLGEFSDRNVERVRRFMRRFVPGEEVTIVASKEPTDSGRLPDVKQELVDFARGFPPAK